MGDFDFSITNVNFRLAKDLTETLGIQHASFDIRHSHLFPLSPFHPLPHSPFSKPE